MFVLYDKQVRFGMQVNSTQIATSKLVNHLSFSKPAVHWREVVGALEVLHVSDLIGAIVQSKPLVSGHLVMFPATYKHYIFNLP